MRRRPLTLATAASVAASPFATWWACGDLSEEHEVLDHSFRAPDLPVAVEAGVGGAAVAVVVGAVVLAATEARRRPLDRLWLRVVITLVLCGAVVGFGGRVLTAGVVGANIGAGMFLLFVFPAVVLVAGTALVRATTLARER
ncbi:MAG: hypothetical protein H0W25_21185 [Acidimicrobiia bacterium]|nr:hypothetical protein [Acidimicrobiia bacterium]